MDQARKKRYLVISDIHGNLRCLEDVVKSHVGKVDGVICLGDVGFICHDDVIETHLSGRPYNEILDRCNEAFASMAAVMLRVSPNVYLVPGNHDQVWLTDRNCYHEILRRYRIHVVHNRAIRLAPNLVVAGAGGTVATFDESERRISGWPFDLKPSDFGMTEKTLPTTNKGAVSWMLNHDFDYRTIRNPKIAECFCRAVPDIDLDHSSDEYRMARASLTSLFYREDDMELIPKFQKEVVECEKKLVDDPVLKFIGTGEYEDIRKKGKKDEGVVRPTDSVILLTHQAPSGCLTGTHWSTLGYKQFHPKDIPDPSEPVKIMGGLPRRCGSTAITEALQKIVDGSLEAQTIKVNRNEGTAKVEDGKIMHRYHNLVCVMNGHTHRPFSQIDEYLGATVLCPGTLYEGYSLVVDVEENEDGHWRLSNISRETHNTERVKNY